MATQAELETYCDAIVTALEAGDYDAADLAHTKALAVLTALPTEVRHASSSIRYREQQISELGAKINKLRATATQASIAVPWQRVKYEYKNPTGRA